MSDNTIQQITCLIKSVNLNSAKDRYSSLLEWLIVNPNIFNDEQKKELISSYKGASDKKIEQGKQDAKKRWNKVQQPEKWLFKEKSSYTGLCEACQNKYHLDDPIFIKNRKGWHMGCEPEDAKENSFYQSYLKQKQGV